MVVDLRWKRNDGIEERRIIEKNMEFFAKQKKGVYLHSENVTTK